MKFKVMFMLSLMAAPAFIGATKYDDNMSASFQNCMLYYMLKGFKIGGTYTAAHYGMDGFNKALGGKENKTANVAAGTIATAAFSFWDMLPDSNFLEHNCDPSLAFFTKWTTAVGTKIVADIVADNLKKENEK